MSSVRLTPRALADLDRISDYGLANFGARSTASYIQGLHDLFGKLAVYPEIGIIAAATNQRRRRHPFRRHIVFYELEAPGIAILRIYPMTRLRKADELPD
nr:type II toxin-antitoxin system RelE/ParE family toxin [uncultured Devosia sp.]